MLSVLIVLGIVFFFNWLFGLFVSSLKNDYS